MCVCLPSLSTWATVWRCRRGAHTAEPCPRCHSSDRSVCPAGTSNTPASGYSSASNPVTHRDSNPATSDTLIHEGERGHVFMRFGFTRPPTSPPLWRAAPSTAGARPSSYGGSTSWSSPWKCSHTHIRAKHQENNRLAVDHKGVSNTTGRLFIIKHTSVRFTQISNQFYFIFGKDSVFQIKSQLREIYLWVTQERKRKTIEILNMMMFLTKKKSLIWK